MTNHNTPSEEMVLQLLNRAIEQNEQIIKRLDTADAKIDRHVSKEETVMRGLTAAFPKKPDGTPDYEGHEVYHSTLIEESRAKANFYRELQHELIKKGMWGLVMILAALVVFWWNGSVPPK